MAVKSEVWLTVVIVAVAGILLALSLTREKPAAPAPVAVPAAVQSAPVAAITATALPAGTPVGAIKPVHEAPAAEKAPAVEKAPAAHAASGIVTMPNAVKARDAFAIQVFSFKDKVRADASLKLLKNKGYPAYMMMSDLGPRGIFYRVRVGSFTSEDEAKKNLESVHRDFKSGIIVAE